MTPNYIYGPLIPPLYEVNWMEETLCSIEIVKENDAFKAKVQSEMGRYVEYTNSDFENLLQQVYEDLHEEIEGTF